MEGNDAWIIGVISAFFILLGFVLPFIQVDYQDSSVSADVDGLVDIDEDAAVSSVSAFSVIGSVLKMFFWTFGDLPRFVDVILLVPRIVLLFIIARNIWIGGGG